MREWSPGPIRTRARDVGALTAPNARVRAEHRPDHPSRAARAAPAPSRPLRRVRGLPRRLDRWLTSASRCPGREARARRPAAAEAPRSRHCAAERLERLLTAEPAGLGEERRREDDPVAEHRQEEQLDVLGAHVVPSVDERPGPRRSARARGWHEPRRRARRVSSVRVTATSSMIQRSSSSSV